MKRSLAYLKELAEGIGPVYTTDDPDDYGVYYQDDIGNEETLLSGAAEPLTREAIQFFVMAIEMVLNGELVEVVW